MGSKTVAIWVVKEEKGQWKVLGGNTVPGTSLAFQIVCEQRNWKSELKSFLDCLVDIERNEPKHNEMFTIEETTT